MSDEPSATETTEVKKSGLGRVLQLLRSPAVKLTFLAIALAGATWAIVSQWDNLVAAISRLPWYVTPVCLVIALVYVFLTMLSWRAVLADLGSRLSVRQAARLFFVSQLGKYVPGGVWNYLAVVEMGAEHEIPRRRSLSAMVVSILISIITAGILALPGIAFADVLPTDVRVWLLVLIPVAACMLIPRVLNTLISFALRLAKRPPLEHPLTLGGITVSSGWALVGWAVSGLLIWTLAIHLGMPATGESYVLAAGGYALSWALGFIVFFMPAGIGVRELVLAAMLLNQLDSGALVLIVLLARVLSTLADVLLGIGALMIGRGRASNAETANAQAAAGL